MIRDICMSSYPDCANHLRELAHVFTLEQGSPKSGRFARYRALEVLKESAWGSPGMAWGGLEIA